MTAIIFKKDFMKNKKFIFIIGESTGLECFKEILKLKIIDISHVISSNKNYNLIIRKICKINDISFSSSNNHRINEIKYKNNKDIEYILISIFSNLIIDKKILKKFNYKCFNFHPGLLPLYPGKNCVSGAIYNQEKSTAVTLHKMKQKIDEGKIIFKKKISINVKKETLISLMLKLKFATIDMVKKFIIHIYKNKTIKMYKNDISKKKYFPKYIPNKGLINKDTSFKDFDKIFRSSYSGPFENSWGKVFFIYNKQKKIIFEYNIINKRKIYFPSNSKIIKMKKNNFILAIKNKILAVKTF